MTKTKKTMEKVARPAMREELTLLVDDLIERAAEHARLLGGGDSSFSGTATTEAEREVADARAALLAAILPADPIPCPHGTPPEVHCYPCGGDDT